MYHSTHLGNAWIILVKSHHQRERIIRILFFPPRVRFRSGASRRLTCIVHLLFSVLYIFFYNFIAIEVMRENSVDEFKLCAFNISILCLSKKLIFHRKQVLRLRAVSCICMMIKPLLRLTDSNSNVLVAKHHPLFHKVNQRIRIFLSR